MKQILLKIIKGYKPENEQEEADKEIMLEFIKAYDNCLLRENKIAHFTASSWIVNEDRTKVLMIYHNIYKNWAWTGGHADGEEDLQKVALREAGEETGVSNIRALSHEPISLENLCVDCHYKNGIFVPSHLHFNVTYLLQADEKEQVRIKADENSGVRWVDWQQAPAMTREECMKEVYSKLNSRAHF